MNPRLFVATLFVLGFTGCSGSRQVVDANYTFADQPEQGLIIASTRLIHDCAGGALPSATLVYVDESFSNSKWGELPINSPFLESDFENPPGHFFVKELPAGPHQLKHLGVHLGKAMTKSLRIPFKVEPGKAIYLGELNVVFTNCDAFPSVELRVKDAWERDSQLYQKQMKNLRSEDVVKQLIPSWPPRQQ